jgi:hypothetical protein
MCESLVGAQAGEVKILLPILRARYRKAAEKIIDSISSASLPRGVAQAEP